MAASTSVYDLSTVACTTCIFDCTNVSAMRSIMKQSGASIHHARAQGPSTHVIASVPHHVHPDSDFSVRIRDVSFRLAVLSHRTGFSITMYVPKHLKSTFEDYWASCVHRVGGHGICESATFYTFGISNDSEMHLLEHVFDLFCNLLGCC